MEHCPHRIVLYVARDSSNQRDFSCFFALVLTMWHWNGDGRTLFSVVECLEYAFTRSDYANGQWCRFNTEYENTKGTSARDFWCCCGIGYSGWPRSPHKRILSSFFPDAWIITSGYQEESTSELIGEVMYNCRMKHPDINISALGVGKWGNIHDCHKLESRFDTSLWSYRIHMLCFPSETLIMNQTHTKAVDGTISSWTIHITFSSMMVHVIRLIKVHLPRISLDKSHEELNVEVSIVLCLLMTPIDITYLCLVET